MTEAGNKCYVNRKIFFLYEFPAWNIFKQDMR